MTVILGDHDLADNSKATASTIEFNTSFQQQEIQIESAHAYPKWNGKLNFTF